jgi:DNA-binding NtrC family response regulator
VNKVAATAVATQTHPVDGADPPLGPWRVLVIDDSNTIRRSAEIFLRQGGHDVLLAEDGFDALAKVLDYQPHLVFCDILMPRLDASGRLSDLRHHQTPCALCCRPGGDALFA